MKEVKERTEKTRTELAKAKQATEIKSKEVADLKKAIKVEKAEYKKIDAKLKAQDIAHDKELRKKGITGFVGKPIGRKIRRPRVTKPKAPVSRVPTPSPIRPKRVAPKPASIKPATRKPITPKAGLEARQAAEDYTTDAFQKVNTGLREGKVVDKRIVEGTDKYLRNAPKFDGTTVRSFTVTTKEKEDLLRSLNQGTIADKAFVSTRKVPTLTDKAALERGITSSDRVVFRIKGKQGVDISDLSLNPGEGEVLYPRNVKFRVTGFTQAKSGGLIADLVEVAK